MRASASTNSLDDRSEDDALSVAPVEQNQLAAFPGAQAIFSAGTLVATTCFASFMTLGLEMPGAMMNWAQFRR